MKILIYGTGGIGGYFGGRLALTDNEVTFVARGKHKEAIQRNGLLVKSIHGDFSINPANVTDNVETLPKQDLILICVKAWQVSEVAQKIKPIVHRDSMVIPLQNGISAPEYLLKELSEVNVLGGLCRVFSKKGDDGVIEHMGFAPSITFGELNNVLSDRVKQVDLLFREAGFESIPTGDIQKEMWKKYLFISSTSSVGAITRVPFGIMRAVPESKKMLQNVLKEMYSVSEKLQIGLESNTISNILKFIDGLPEHATASMQRDIMENRPSELEDQTGKIIQLGKQVGVPTPINQFIYDALKPMELTTRNNI